jgi:tyrosinase
VTFIDDRGIPAVNVEIQISGSDSQGKSYLTWTPVKATARITASPPPTAAVDVLLRNPANAVGRLRFDTTRSDQGSSDLTVTLASDGTPTEFWVAGEFGQASVDYGDAAIEAILPADSSVVGRKDAMVRIRKHAEHLSATERDRFLAAFGTLNGAGHGRFADFRDMHVRTTLKESHGNTGFLPWHRTYLLDLERELQAIDSTVALPYWRFDQPAPNLFTKAFLGEADPTGTVHFTVGHPFGSWVAAGIPGIIRTPRFPVASAPSLSNEVQTLALGGPTGLFAGFRRMEGDPHGFAHTSFNGPIMDPATSPQDPLFFLLHANVDRLWAKWQWVKHRADPNDGSAFVAPTPPLIGDHLNDTMWPWNNDTNPPRPSTAPGGPLSPSPVTAAPGGAPAIRAMLDYQAVTGGAQLGFDYDDVPFELPSAQS